MKNYSPPSETYAISQGNLGDCYLVSALFDFIRNPHLRGKLFSMFEENGDDIKVTIPDAKEYPVMFKNGALKKDGNKNINGSLGIQMVEDTLRETRSLKYGTSNDITSLTGGNQIQVYNALLNNNGVALYGSNPNFKAKTKEELKDNIDFLTKYIESLEETYKERLKDIETYKLHLLIRPTQYQSWVESAEEILEKIAKCKANIRSANENLSAIGSKHSVDSDELFNKFLKYGKDDNYVVSLGSKKGVYNPDKSIYGNHAYSVLGIDSENKTVRVVNPWNSAQCSVISFDEFNKYFDVLNVAKIN